jgi:uncharacterized protein YidB (DUF937 family)
VRKDIVANQKVTVEDVTRATDELRQQLQSLHQQTGYEDLEHGLLGLDIVHHVVEEVAEHTGLGGHIEPTQDAAAHTRSEGWLTAVRNLRSEAQTFLGSHANEDLEIASKALTIAEGSLEEVAERYD